MYIKSGNTKFKAECLYAGKANATVPEHAGHLVQFARSGFSAQGAAVHAKAQVRALSSATGFFFGLCHVA